MKRKTITTCIVIISGIFSLFYYSIKFYTDKQLILEDNPFILWVALFVLIFCSLILGIVNTFKTDKVERQNDKLIELVEKMSQDAEENHYNTLASIYNSRDVEIDVLDMCKKILERADCDGELD